MSALVQRRRIGILTQYLLALGPKLRNQLGDRKAALGGCGVQMEARIPADVRDALAALRHQIKVRGVYSPGATGGGQAVMREARQLRCVRSAKGRHSDPRADHGAISVVSKDAQRRAASSRLAASSKRSIASRSLTTSSCP